MRWEELTGDQFPQAVEQASGVCLLPLSVIERHAHHLPMGTDMYIGRDLCRRAAELETAVVFPDYIFTQILEAQHCAGTIAIEPDLIVSLLENVCREIARNGLKKIVLVNAHGGNNSLIQFLAQRQLATPRDYVVYIAEPPLLPEDVAAVEGQWESTVDGHAGEWETSAFMAIRPDLVHSDQLRDDGEGLAAGTTQAAARPRRQYRHLVVRRSPDPLSRRRRDQNRLGGKGRPLVGGVGAGAGRGSPRHQSRFGVTAAAKRILRKTRQFLIALAR